MASLVLMLCFIAAATGYGVAALVIGALDGNRRATWHGQRALILAATLMVLISPVLL